MASGSDGSGGARWPPWVASWVAAAAAMGLLAALSPAWPPAAGEGSCARWLRMLAEHPIRGTLALGLVLWALGPRRPPPGDDPGHGVSQGL